MANLLIGIPSYNEADSIRNTLRKIDRGLVNFFKKHRSLIVNVDSMSEDETPAIFLSTNTHTPKISVFGGKTPRGKGINIYTLLRIGQWFDAGYICMVDADVTSIREEWIKLLLEPLFQKRAEFVLPLYRRNQYEGNTTNHFCYPLIKAWFNKEISQPIGGEFGMSRKFVDYILRQKWPFAAYLYGVDIFLTLHALGGGFRVHEVNLGRKIHKPSFSKIIPMFQQVASTMIYLLGDYKNQKKIIEKGDRKIKRRVCIDYLSRKPQETEISTLYQFATERLHELPEKKIEEYLGVRLKDFKITSKKILVSQKKWVKILAFLIEFIQEHKIDEQESREIASFLLPFFLLRVLTYFEEIDKIKSPWRIERIISQQTKSLFDLTNRT